MDAAPIYVFMLLISVSILSFKIGSNVACDNNHKIEYRYIPRSLEELEKNNASNVLNDLI